MEWSPSGGEIRKAYRKEGRAVGEALEHMSRPKRLSFADRE